MNIQQTHWKDFNLGKSFHIIYTFSGIKYQKKVFAGSPFEAWNKFKADLSKIALENISIVKIT